MTSPDPVGAVPARAAARTATCARAARATLWLAPVAVWLVVSAASGSWWFPGTSMLAWELVVVAAVAAFVASEELAAIARHRNADAAAAGRLEWLAHATPAPRGADAAVGSGGVRAVVVVVDDDCALDVGARRLRGRTGFRRGVGVRALRSAAASAGAAPLVATSRCAAPGRCAGPRSVAGVAVVCPSAAPRLPGGLSTQPDDDRCAAGAQRERS